MARSLTRVRRSDRIYMQSKQTCSQNTLSQEKYTRQSLTHTSRVHRTDHAATTRNFMVVNPYMALIHKCTCDTCVDSPENYVYVSLCTIPFKVNTFLDGCPNLRWLNAHCHSPTYKTITDGHDGCPMPDYTHKSTKCTLMMEKWLFLPKKRKIPCCFGLKLVPQSYKPMISAN